MADDTNPEGLKPMKFVIVALNDDYTLEKRGAYDSFDEAREAVKEANKDWQTKIGSRFVVLPESVFEAAVVENTYVDAPVETYIPQDFYAECPMCGAAVGEQCVIGANGQKREGIHNERRVANAQKRAANTPWILVRRDMAPIGPFRTYAEALRYRSEIKLEGECEIQHIQNVIDASNEYARPEVARNLDGIDSEGNVRVTLA